MAIKEPVNLRWVDDDLTFYWDNDPAAEYATYTLDGVQRGFLYYHAMSYSPDVQLLSPGNHTFCVYCCDEKLNCSDWACITISIIDTIPPLEHQTPAEPYNLNWLSVNATDVLLTWDSDDSVKTFTVFLDDAMVAYAIHDHSFTYLNLSPGVHKLGVSSVDSEGYVSDQVFVTIQFNMHLQASILLADAYWPFEATQTPLDGQQTLTNGQWADYAYQGTFAALLQGGVGDVPYLILPAISDVQSYDSLELTFFARGGYWSRLSEMWARATDVHRLQVGSLPYIPREEDFLSLVTPLLDTILPYARQLTFEDPDADSLLFWREIRVPLRGAQRYIAIYSECQANNYVVIDEVRIARIPSLTPDAGSGDPSNPGTDPSNPGTDPEDPPVDSALSDRPVRQVDKYLSPDGRLLIHKAGQIYDLFGRRLR